MKKTNEIYVFGHKNPDTDAVTSAINLSYLKQQLGMNTTPRVLGNINSETEFVLNYFNVKKPEYLNNVKLQIKDLDHNNNHSIDDNQSIYYAYNYMQEHGINNIPILNNKKVEGLIAMKHIAKYMISDDSKILNASYQNIIEALEAEEILKYNDIIEGTFTIAAFKNTTFIENIKVDNNTIVLVGDRYKVIEYAITNKAKLIVITGNHNIPEELLELAKKNKVNIIKTSFHTYEAAKMISLSNYAIQIAIKKEDIISIDENDLVSDFKALANKYKYTYYPVVDKNKKFIGNIELIDTNKENRKQVMLTDHNEYDQSVDGLQEAEILEIVDHHNIGSIGTMAPINFRSMPVGSTNTVLYKMYKEHNIKVPKENAGLMLSGIISDTLLLVSPTTTELDKTTAKELAEIAGVDLNTYGLEMLKAGTSLKGKTEEDILFGDFKLYEVNNKKIGVTQVSTFDINDFNDSIEKYKELINKNAENNNYDVFAFFITDILKNGSYVYYNDNAIDIMSKAFDIENMPQGTYLDGCVSRKKQVIPKIMKVLD